MTVKDRITKDLKDAMLSKNQQAVDVLKMLKSAILYEEVAAGSREQGLPDSKVLAVLAKESKKRADAAVLYSKVHETERAKKEQQEKDIIDAYLPKQLDDEELLKIIRNVIASSEDKHNMGQIIGAVKKQVGLSADGAVLARLVKQELAS